MFKIFKHRSRKLVSALLILALAALLCVHFRSVPVPAAGEATGAAVYTPYIRETFDYTDRVGSPLPLKDSGYGNWTYYGNNVPVTRISQDGSRTYVELQKDPSRDTAILGRQVSYPHMPPEIMYYEYEARFPKAKSGEKNYDVSMSLSQDAIRGPDLARVKATGAGTCFTYSDGDTSVTAKDLAGQIIYADSSKWYKFILFMDFTSNPGTYTLKIEENGMEIFNKAHIQLNTAEGDTACKIDSIGFQNDNPSNPIYLDNVVLRSGMACNEDFESYAPGPVTTGGWTSVSPGANVGFTYESEDTNQYMKISNPANGTTFSTTLPFLNKGNNGLDLTADRSIMEFDFKGSKVAKDKQIFLYDSNGNEAVVRITINNGNISVLTTGKETAYLLKSAQFVENKWYHFKIDINYQARIFDVYIDDMEHPKAEGLCFVGSTLLEIPGPAKNIGRMALTSAAGSGVFALDNIRIYPKEGPANLGLTTEDIPSLNQVLTTSTVKNEKIEALWKLKEIGTTQILPSLLLAMEDDQRGVRLIASRILGYFNKGIEPDLYSSLLSPNFFAREAIINQLVLHGESKEKIASVVQQSLQGRDVEKRKNAAAALGDLGSYAKNTVPALLNVLNNTSDDLTLRLRALNSLWFIDEESIPLSSWTLALDPAAEGFYQLMNKAHEVLLTGGKDSVPALRKVLASPDRQVKTRAAWLLGSIGPDSMKAKNDLIHALTEEDWYVRWEVKRALQNIAPKDPAALQALASVPEDTAPPASGGTVTLTLTGSKAIVNNGVITMEIGTSGSNFANVNVLKRNSDGINLFNSQGEYWMRNGVNNGAPKGAAKPSEFRVITNTSEMVELSFKVYATDSVPFDLDYRYVVKPGGEGYYMYCIVGKSPDYPDGYITEVSTKFRVNPSIFNYRTYSERLQGEMISPEMVSEIHENEFMNETYRMSNGDIWAKYAWQMYDLDSNVYGFMGENTGLWLVVPSRDHGANYLQYHMGAGHETETEPVILAHADNPFFSADAIALTGNKILGPYFLYTNTGSNHTEAWVDAKRKAEELKAQWPFGWVSDPNYVKERGSLTGKLILSDGTPVKEAKIVLCQPDPNNDNTWQKPYGSHYYTAATNEDGSFAISQIAPDNYTLFALKDGIYGEVRKDGVLVQANTAADVGKLVLTPKSSGNLVWQIGIPNRSSKEFKNGNNPRSYDNFLRYREFFPNDVNYTVGQSDYTKDFYFWQPVQAVDGKYPVWKINFNMDSIPQGDGVLTIATAGSRDVTLYVKLNGTKIGTISIPYEMDSGAIMRNSPYGVNLERELHFDTSFLQQGMNTITLETARGGWLQNICYDFIRFETAPKSQPDYFTDIKARWAKEDGLAAYNPEVPVSRADLAALVTRAAGFSPSKYFGSYQDINGSEWYADDVQSAYLKQLIASDSKFNPNNNATREEMASVVMRAYNYRIQSLAKFNMTVFTDTRSISSWAAPYVQAGLATGIVHGASGTEYGPKSTVTRREALEAMNRLIENLSGIRAVISAPAP